LKEAQLKFRKAFLFATLDWSWKPNT